MDDKQKGFFMKTSLSTLVGCALFVSLSACIPPDNNEPVDLPPNPGIAGKASFAGIDSDQDGVRDDVQRHIILANTDNPAVTLILLNLAKTSEAGLNSFYSNRVVPHNYVTETFRARSCTRLYDPDNAHQRIIKVEKAIGNTVERWKFQLKLAKAALGGKETIIPSVTEEECAYLLNKPTL
jgi:hypothetical protein